MEQQKTINITPENLASKVDDLGGWSSWHLAEKALKHYHPEKYGKYNTAGDPVKDAQILESMGFEYWKDVILKYHQEVGYTQEDLDPELVNEF